MENFSISTDPILRLVSPPDEITNLNEPAMSDSSLDMIAKQLAAVAGKKFISIGNTETIANILKTTNQELSDEVKDQC